MAILLILLALFGFVLGGSSNGTSSATRAFPPNVCSNRMTSKGDSGLCRHVSPRIRSQDCSKRMSAASRRRDCPPPANP